MAIRIQKASGSSEEYSEEKVRASLMRAGADQEATNRIAEYMRAYVKDGMTTKEIYTHIYQILRDSHSPILHRYNLKQAIMALGPTGFPFEKYVAGMLAHYGYDVQTNQLVMGTCVSQEVDVVAEKDGKKIMVECKFHMNPGSKSGLRTSMYTYARFLDIRHQGFTDAWLVTNTKISSEGIQYGNCMNVKIISWDHPHEGSLRSMVERANLHPITCDTSLSLDRTKELLSQGVVFLKDQKSSVVK